MRMVERIYIDGAFVAPHGTDWFDLFDPTRAEVIGRVRLADVEDARRAIAAAKRAFATWSRTSKVERIDLLRRLHDAVLAKGDELERVTMLEYGAPITRARWTSRYAAEAFLNAAKTLEGYDFERQFDGVDVVREPLGVAALITPWNADASFICNKLAYALAAGCTAVIKPSELSALQTEVITESL